MILSFIKQELKIFFGNFNYGFGRKDLKKRRLFISLITAFFILLILIISLGIYTAPPNYALPFYIKRAQEKVVLKILPSAEMKTDYLVSLQEKRLNDLRFIVEHKHYECLLACAQRYSGNAGELSEYIMAHNLKNKADSTVEKFRNHRKQLEELVEQIPKDQNLDWKFVVDSMNYLDSYINNLSSI